jgi:molybdate transport system substrate-binding protein
MMRLRRLLALLASSMIAMTTAAHADDYPVAPDVVVFCPLTLRPVVTQLGRQWTQETGIPVRVFAAPTWANLAQLARHTRDDVIIGEGDAAAASAGAQNLIKSETLLQLWQNKLVAASLAAELSKARAASATTPLDLASVAGKAPIAIVDPGVATAGAESQQALQSLGLWDAVTSKSIGVVDTADAAFLLTQGDVKLAVLYATDVAGHPDFAVTDTLPAANPPIVYWAAQTERALSPNAAKFLDFLHRAEVRAQGREAGLEVLP